MTPALERILTMTEAKPTGQDTYLGHCLAHGSKRHRDLSIKLTGTRILLHCFAQCETRDIVAALNLELKDLFTDADAPRGQRPTTPKPVHVDRVALAFKYELHALDLRLRAEGVLNTANSISISELPDNDLDRLVDAVAQAYIDLEQAALLEGDADGERAKAWAGKERTVHDAA